MVDEKVNTSLVMPQATESINENIVVNDGGENLFNRSRYETRRPEREN